MRIINNDYNILSNGLNPFELNDSEYKVAIRFTAPYTAVYDNLAFYIYEGMGTRPTFRVGLQAEVAGEPSGTFLASNTIANPQDGWRTVTIPSTTLTKGNVYYLVIQYESGTIGLDNYISVASTGLDTKYQFLNDQYEFAPVVDNKLGFFWTWGGIFDWNDEQSDPIFVIYGPDSSKTFGQIYEHITYCPINTTTTVVREEEYSPTKSNLVLTHFGVYVQKGSPTANLTYTISEKIDGVETVIRSGIICTPSAGSGWKEVQLSSPITFVAGRIYYASITSTAAGWNTYAPGWYNPPRYPDQQSRSAVKNSAGTRTITSQNDMLMYFLGDLPTVSHSLTARVGERKTKTNNISGTVGERKTTSNSLTGTIGIQHDSVLKVKYDILETDISSYIAKNKTIQIMSGFNGENITVFKGITDLPKISGKEAKISAEDLIGRLSDKTYPEERTIANLDTASYIAKLLRDSGYIHPQGSIIFDGYQDWLSIGLSSLNATAGQYNTIEFWMLWDGTELCMPVAWDSCYNLIITNGKIGFNTGNGDVTGFVYDKSELVGKWVHIVAVFYNGTPNATNSKIYVNGVKKTLTVSGTPVSKVLSASMTLSVGSGLAWGLGSTAHIRSGEFYIFNGMMDELRVWNKELSQSEVTASYNGGAGTFGSAATNLIFGCHFDNCSLEDYSGSGKRAGSMGRLNFGWGKVVNTGKAYDMLLENSEETTSFEWISM